MNKILLGIVFFLMIGAQWYVPAKMIYQEEKVLKEGTAYKFRTNPIDPSDPFRGKYVVLNYEVNSFETNDSIWNYEDPIYVYIEKDSLGFAKATSVSNKLTDADRDYVLADFRGHYNGILRFQLPFNRFYMNEDKAMDAEIAVREVAGDTLPTTCYGLVYVLGDRAVLEDVLIDDVSLKDYVEEP